MEDVLVFAEQCDQAHKVLQTAKEQVRGMAVLSEKTHKVEDSPETFWTRTVESLRILFGHEAAAFAERQVRYEAMREH